MTRLIKNLARLSEKLLRAIKFWIKYKFLPPPRWTDLVGYESLLRVIENHKLLQGEGDLVEIGVFVGGGTYKLSKYLSRKKCEKRIYAIDVFDISFDMTKNTQNQIMAELYASALQGRNQWEVFCATTRGCHNITVIKGDSRKITLPAKKICFAFIDGNHDPAYVINDFYLVWPALSPGGIVAFDDYGYDLPFVTKTIDELSARHAPEIAKRWHEGKIIHIQKRLD